MSSPKTRPGVVKVEDFLDKLEDDREFEANELIDIMSDITGEPPVMWGGSIIGFGSMDLKYASGRELEWPILAFSPRKHKISLYITNQAEDYIPQLENLGGKYSIGKGCIYLRKLNDVDIDKLRELIQKAYDDIKAAA